MRDERDVAAVPDPGPTDHEHEHDHEHRDHADGPRPNGGDPGDNTRVSPVDTATAEERAARVDDGARPDLERPEAADEESEVTNEEAAAAEREAEAQRVDAKERVDEERVRPDDLGDGELSDQEIPPTGRPFDAREADAVPVEAREVDAVPVEAREVDAVPVEARDADAVPETPDRGLWDPSDVASLRERWREIQLQFVDDPEAAASGAAALVDEAARSLVSAVESRRAALAGPTTDDSEPETERLRLALQRYRDFLDRVLQV